MVIEHFANVLFMFIVNVSNKFFSVLLKIFCKYFVFAIHRLSYDLPLCKSLFFLKHCQTLLKFAK